MSEIEAGEYLLITAERGEHRHAVALLYTSATDNSAYRRAAQHAEHIFFNGEAYMVDSFAYGLDKPVGPVSDFHTLLMKWNAESADGKFAPLSAAEEPPASRSSVRVLLSEEPIAAIWLRLRQFQSFVLAKKLIVERTRRASVALSVAEIAAKAEGVAYCLRNAADYFVVASPSISQRVVNLYYGSLALASAEMLAAPDGPKALSEIEEHTKRGHGLFTVDGSAPGLDHLVVGILRSGFFAAWLQTLGLVVDQAPAKRPRTFDEAAKLPNTAWLSVERLFASIPELGDLFEEIFDSAPRWIVPVYDHDGNAGLKREGAIRTYVKLIDETGRLTREDVANFQGPISDISPVASPYSGRHFRVAIDHPGKATCWEALRIHHSPFRRNALILPIFGVVNEYRIICVTLLYALSIVVRYRPGIWRRVQEGDLDQMRALAEAFLAVVERVLPEQFLETITGQRVFAKQPSAF
jgi:hypothetical protein